MARLPSDRLATRRTITGQDAVWIAIRALGAGLNVDRVVARMASADWPRLVADRKTVADYLRRLTAAGILMMTDDGGLVLTADPGPATPRIRPDGTQVTMGAGRRAIWRTIRMLGQFTLVDLVKLGSTEEVMIGAADAKRYVRWLVDGGYLMVLDRPANNAIPTTWRLIPSRNTGPLPPQIQRSHRIWDPNVGKVTWSQEPPECL